MTIQQQAETQGVRLLNQLFLQGNHIFDIEDVIAASSIENIPLTQIYKILFEAPPTHMISQEMENFLRWFNKTAPNGTEPLPPLTRAGIAHIYFECIHPFSDGNGRIVLKSIFLSQKHLKQPQPEIYKIYWPKKFSFVPDHSKALVIF